MIIFDTIKYTKNGDGTFTKTIIQNKVFNLEGEQEALEAQIKDLKAGTADTAEEQAEVNKIIVNYEEALLELQK